MKETKRFFENNRLNKGYSRIYTPQKSDESVIRDKYKHMFPPIDIIAEYEDLSPGTFEKFLDMARSEQNHRHSMDLLTAERYNRASKLGRMFSIIFVAIVSLTTVILTAQGSIFSAIVFCASAFFTIALVSLFHSKTDAPKPSRPSNFVRNNNTRHKKDFYPGNRKSN
jgi:uncharacterized membrane protein